MMIYLPIIIKNIEKFEKDIISYYNFNKIAQLKDWKTYYLNESNLYNEKQNYIENLKLQNNGLLTGTQAKALTNIKEIKKLFIELSKLFENSTILDQPELIKNVNDIRKKISILKLSLKNYDLEEKQINLKNQMNSSMSNADRFILQQELELQQLLRESTMRTSKVEESNLRKEFINALKNGESDPNFINLMLAKINYAKNKRQQNLQNKYKQFASNIKEKREQNDLLKAIQILSQANFSIKGDLKKKIKKQFLKNKQPEIIKNIRQLNHLSPENYREYIENYINDYVNYNTPEMEELEKVCNRISLFTEKLRQINKEIKHENTKTDIISDTINEAHFYISLAEKTRQKLDIN